MAENLPDEDLLIRYLDDEMQPGERRDFEALVHTDTALHERLEKLRVARDAVAYYGITEQVAQVRSEWEQSHAAAVKPGGAKRIAMPAMLRYAVAAASIIVAVFLFKSFFVTAVTPEKIYREAYVGYTLGDTRSGSASRSPVEQAYRQHNYNEVVLLGRQGTLTAREQLLLGIAYLQVGNLPSAIRQLKELELQADATYRQDAEFYAGLAYLKNRQYDKALDEFQKIRNDPRHLYHNQVSEAIIQEIKRLQ